MSKPTKSDGERAEALWQLLAHLLQESLEASQDLGDEEQLDAGALPKRETHTVDGDGEFWSGFMKIMSRVEKEGSLTPEGTMAAHLLFDVFRNALEAGDSDTLVALVARLVSGDKEEKNYRRMKGAVALTGWNRALWHIVREMRARDRGFASVAAMLIGSPAVLGRYDDRAGRLRSDDVLEVIDEVLGDDLLLDRKTLPTIAAKLAGRCGAFDYDEDSRDIFRKYIPDEVP